MTAAPVVSVRHVADLTRGEREAIRALLAHALPGIDHADYEARHAEGAVLVWIHGELASHAAFVNRWVTVGRQRVPIVGIGGVATHAEFRGQGLARSAVDAALRAWSPDARFGLLMCEQELVAYYAAAGWQLVDAELTCRGPSGSERVPYRPMIRPLGAASWPAGPIDLAGPRF